MSITPNSSNHGQMVTAFTIVFVAIMATTIRRYALYKAQNGAYVSDLEQLHASISLPDTVKMIFFLRKFSFITVALIVVWCFYYLGCQAQEWEYTFALSGSWYNTQAAYANDAAIFHFSGVREEPGSTIDFINTKMKTYLDTPAESLIFEPPGVDADGDVLIPDMRYEQYLTSRGKKSPRRRTQKELQSWMTVHPSAETFVTGHGQKLWFHLKDLHKNASKQGIWDYAGPPEGTRVLGEFKFRTSYLDMECASLEALPITSFPKDVADQMSTSINMTADEASALRTFDIYHKWTPSYWSDLGTNISKSSPVINGMRSGILHITCNITRPDVEIEAKCSEVSCVPRKMRYIADTTNPPHIYSTPFDNSTWAFEFFDNFLWSSGNPETPVRNATGLTLLERWLELPKFVDMLSGASTAQFTAAIADDLAHSFSPNITRAMNSYFNLGVSLGIPSPATGYNNYNTFNFHGAMYEPAYRLHWAWIVLDYVSCILLLVAAIWSFWLRKHTLAPDIFGYVSSLTRDNPHVPVEGGSALSGVDRAKLMNKVKIRIGNVGQDGDIGKVGIVYIHEDATVIPLCKDRKYI